MLVGRDDKCAKFLVDILENNKLLIISLCPLSKENIEIIEEPIENEEIINKTKIFLHLLIIRKY